MADSVTVKYIWPPNFDGNPPETNQPGWRRVKVKMAGISDGTGESEVVKVRMADLRRPDGQPVVRSAVERIEWTISGYTSILLQWDRTPKETIAVLTLGGRVLDYTSSGGLAESSDGTDGTGDVLLTSSGATAGDSYDITLSLLLF